MIQSLVECWGLFTEVRRCTLNHGPQKSNTLSVSEPPRPRQFIIPSGISCTDTDILLLFQPQPRALINGKSQIDKASEIRPVV